MSGTPIDSGRGRFGAGAALAATLAAGCAATTIAPPPPPPGIDPSAILRSEEEELLEAFSRALAELVRSLVAWIGEASGRDVDAVLADPPDVIFALVGDVLEFDGGVLFVEPDLRGAYERASDVIVLTLPWHIDDIDDRSVLLHELVHAVQLATRRWRCLDQTEWEAYRLQHRWLAEHGVDMVVDWLLVGMLSHCPEPS